MFKDRLYKIIGTN